MSGYKGDKFTDAPDDVDMENEEIFEGLGRGKQLGTSNTGPGLGRGAQNMSKLKAILAKKQNARNPGSDHYNQE